MNLEIVVTGDGSHTLAVDNGKEKYHSGHGAVMEARHVYIKHGLIPALMRAKEAISVLELGFGTGLNAILTLLEMEPLELRLNYISFEPFMIPGSIWQSLNYGKIIPVSDKYMTAFAKVFEGQSHIQPVPDMSFSLLNKPWSHQPELPLFDVLYYDAFAPSYQPELWNEKAFRIAYDYLKSGGQMVTFCAKGEVRRLLQKTGFMVERLEGPPGKREMLRATKPE